MPGNPGAPVSNNYWRDPQATPNIPPEVLFPLCCGGDPQQWKPVSQRCARPNQLSVRNMTVGRSLRVTEKRRAPRGRAPLLGLARSKWSGT
jgi:hypothetical protein